MFNCVYVICCLLLVSHISAKSTKRKGAPNTDDNWTGSWFPHVPGGTAAPFSSHQIDLGNVCDDGVHLIGIDFAPSIKRDSYHNLCVTAHRTAFEPNLNTTSIITEYFLPPAYVPPVKCLNESISYEEQLPTYGAFRPLAPKYGTYKYLPPQRWIHSLARGAIVMLYHPCAFSKQVELLQNTVRGCVYRHIISTSQLLTAERPLALLVWRKSLQMSVVDDKIVTSFITQSVKKGPLADVNFSSEKDFYEMGLLAEAHLVTDLQDSELCGFREM